MNFDGLRFVVVGSGLWGAVISERIATVLDEPVVILEKRKHIGGNCYSELDRETGIECHRYGTHIFHTSDNSVWNYITKFTGFTNYQHKVYTQYKNRVYSMPINLLTVNSFFGINLMPSEVYDFIQNQRKETQFLEPKNLEEKAISLIGRSLYEAFIKGYTEKQWGRAPKDLPSSIITRLPVRNNYNNNYFNDPFQGLPMQGYLSLFKKLLSNKNISVLTGIDYFSIKNQIPDNCLILYSGALDEFFDYKYGELQWRSLRFEEEILTLDDFQGTSVMNYADTTIPYTRIHEYKHLHPERKIKINKTVISREFPKNYKKNSERYYPVNDQINNEKYNLYLNESKHIRNLIIGGRLGAYKYWDMDKTIKHALDTFKNKIIGKNHHYEYPCDSNACLQ